MGEGRAPRRLAFIEDNETVRAALVLALEALPGIQVVAAEDVTHLAVQVILHQ